MNRTRKSFYAAILALIVLSISSQAMAQSHSENHRRAASDLIVSEIMYNPASAEDDWEWIEVFNTGTTAVDLSGFVFDDNDNSPIASANIASGTIASSGTAILFNVDEISAADFNAAWNCPGTSLTLIAVTNWPTLANSSAGDRFGLWENITDYDGGNSGTFANALIDINYDDNQNGWPNVTNGTSISLMTRNHPQNAGSSWYVNASGSFEACTSTAAGGNGGADIGSPGEVPAVSPTVLTLSDFGITQVNHIAIIVLGVFILLALETYIVLRRIKLIENSLRRDGNAS